MSKWVKIIHDDHVKSNDGFTYECEQGHRWFVTFHMMNATDWEPSKNTCQECERAAKAS